MVSWSPSIRVGPSRYFSVPSSSQANSGWSATSSHRRVAGELGEGGLARLAGCHSMAWSGGVPWPSADRQASPAGCGGAVGSAGNGRLLPDRAGLGTALGVAGLGRGGVGSSGAVDSRGRRGGLGCGWRGDLLGGVHGAEPQHGGLADQLDQLVALHVRHGDDQLLVPGGGHLGLAHAQAVDPALDDRLGQLQAVGVDRSAAGGVLGGQRDRGAALEVEAELGRPGVADRHQGEQPGDQDGEHDQGASGMTGRRVATYVKSFGGSISRRWSVSVQRRWPAALGRRAGADGLRLDGQRSLRLDRDLGRRRPGRTSSTALSSSRGGDHPGDGLLEHRQLGARGDLEHDLLVADRDDGAEQTAAQHHPGPGVSSFIVFWMACCRFFCGRMIRK